MASTRRLLTCARWCRSIPRPSWVPSAAPTACLPWRRTHVYAAGAPRSCRSSPTRRSTISTVRRCASRRRTSGGRPPTRGKPQCCGRWIASPRRCGDRCRVENGHENATLVIPGRPVGPGLESISPTRGYGFRAPRLARPRNDGRWNLRTRTMAMYDNLLANVPTDLWIGGQWRKASDGARFDVIDPATENKIASVASASVEDAKAAIDAAQGAFEAWAGKKPRERAEILRKAYELIVRDADRFAKLITIENGKALSDSKGEVLYSAEFFRWNAEEAVRAIGQIYNAPVSGARVVAQYRPAGVAVLVTPWNFPAAMATRKIGPALAAGCPVVLKPASETPLTMLALMPLLEE